MRESASREFDFDEWMLLAQSDPQAFEEKRSNIIEQKILSAPSHRQHRLRCLQWRIDTERRKCATPLAACVEVNRMMWDFMVAKRGFLHALYLLTGQNLRPFSPSDTPSGKVLPFRTERRRNPQKKS